LIDASFGGDGGLEVVVCISGGPTSVVAEAIVVMRKKRRFGLLGIGRLKEKVVRIDVDFDRIYRTMSYAWRGHQVRQCKS